MRLAACRVDRPLLADRLPIGPRISIRSLNVLKTTIPRRPSRKDARKVGRRSTVSARAWICFGAPFLSGMARRIGTTRGASLRRAR
jgi:hypothetical protein